MSDRCVKDTQCYWKNVSCIMRNIEFMNLSVTLQIGANCILEVKQGVAIQQNLEEHFAYVLLYRIMLFLVLFSSLSRGESVTLENELYFHIS